jgi:hypothetical protein
MLMALVILAAANAVAVALGLVAIAEYGCDALQWESGSC